MNTDCQGSVQTASSSPSPLQHVNNNIIQPGKEAAGLHSHGEEVLLCELQVVIIAEPPQHGPGGLVSAPLDEQRVQEQEACGGRGGASRRMSRLRRRRRRRRARNRESVRPLSESPLSLTPSAMFLLTTFFTSSKA